MQGPPLQPRDARDHYRGKSIAEVLDLTVDQALPLLENFPPIANKLRTLQDVGLGYIELGQSATTLDRRRGAAGEAVARAVARGTGRTLYILDEPTTGLHFEDTRKLLDVLNKLVDQGNTVVVIEHNLDVIKSADHVIDLGPEGGEAGGLHRGRRHPEDVALKAGSQHRRVPEGHPGRHRRRSLCYNRHSSARPECGLPATESRPLESRLRPISDVNVLKSSYLRS